MDAGRPEDGRDAGRLVRRWSKSRSRFPRPRSLAPHAGRRDWTPIAIFGMWACGFAAIALIRFRGWLRIRAAVARASPLRFPRRPASVKIRSSPGLLEPGVVGGLRPILLLPEGIAERLTPPQLEAVLAHELCHVRRRDNLFASIHMMVEAMFWFHPLVWWIGARLVEERERACDEEVLSLGSEPRVYAEAILNVCKLYVGIAAGVRFRSNRVGYQETNRGHHDQSRRSRTEFCDEDSP